MSKTSWRFYRKNLYCFLANSKYSTFSLSKFVPGRREQQPEQLKIQQQQTIQTTNSSFFFCFFCFCFFLFFLSFLPGVVSTRHNNSYDMVWSILFLCFFVLSGPVCSYQTIASTRSCVCVFCVDNGLPGTRYVFYTHRFYSGTTPLLHHPHFCQSAAGAFSAHKRIRRTVWCMMTRLTMGLPPRGEG